MIEQVIPLCSKHTIISDNYYTILEQPDFDKNKS